MTSGKSNLVDVTAGITVQTEKAFMLDDGRVKVWVPKSQVEDNGDGTFSMPENLAYEKGLI